jgi:hypothetical protein
MEYISVEEKNRINAPLLVLWAYEEAVGCFDEALNPARRRCTQIKQLNGSMVV